MSDTSSCPICDKEFPNQDIEVHVNKCIFLNTYDETRESGPNKSKRNFGVFQRSPADIKKAKLDSAAGKSSAKKSHRNSSSFVSNKIINLDADNDSVESLSDDEQPKQPLPSTSRSANNQQNPQSSIDNNCIANTIPLAEKMRPNSIDDYVGQSHIIGSNTILRNVLDKNEVPSMIFWGPPGCGKTTLAHIIAARCKRTQNSRFVKLSATMVGVNDVKEVVKVAKNEQQFKRKTILFMDEIHRFNKLQQDIFLPHVESGIITLIGATTENPSFTLNSALLSRCRVIILEKLKADDMYKILERSLATFCAVVVDGDQPPPLENLSFIPKAVVEKPSLVWLAEMCDGDARIALNSLQLAMQSILESADCPTEQSQKTLKRVTLEAIKDGIKKSHLLYDRKGDQHYDMISALHKSIRASDDNAAVYWCTRMILGGEDPRYICRRMVRAASEDIGLADPKAVSVALSALDAVQLVGMPESDVIIVQCAIYLARAPKSQEAYRALLACKRDIEECKGPLPSVPLHLRNAPTKLMREIGCGKGYNMRHKDSSGLAYMPEGMEERNYF